jgi:hypothetical protein
MLEIMHIYYLSLAFLFETVPFADNKEQNFFGGRRNVLRGQKVDKELLSRSFFKDCVVKL